MKTKTSERILEYVKKHKRVTPKELGKQLTISDRALYKQLNSLVVRGELQKFGKPPQTIYTVGSEETLFSNIKTKPFKITKQQQLKELTTRVTPILNVDILIYKDGKFLIGQRSKSKSELYKGLWLFPGGRMQFDESPQETAHRILKTETPGVKAHLRRLVTAVSDKGYDHRAYGVTLYYIFDYVSGEPKSNYQLENFKWITHEELLNSPSIFDVDKSALAEVNNAIRQMYSNQDEVLVEVDSNNKEIGSLIKRTAHLDPSRYHRAAHIMIFTSDGELTLHQRSLNKAQGAGKWDMFGGHQVYGQTIDQCAYSELAEELGIHTNLKLKSVGLYQSNTQSEYYYLYYGIDNGPYGYDKNEVQQIAKFNCSALLAGKYDKDFEILPHVYNYVEELREVWGGLPKETGV